jgi:hypothetical protein
MPARVHRIQIDEATARPLLQGGAQSFRKLPEGFPPFRLIGIVPQLRELGLLPCHPFNRLQREFHVLSAKLPAVRGHPGSHVFGQITRRVALGS